MRHVADGVLTAYVREISTAAPARTHARSGPGASPARGAVRPGAAFGERRAFRALVGAGAA
ncbi:MAG TPA: hypothetical protein VFR49_15385 [Solirubrobacteraceae bacterium]|nr:hypothetical protein [Solirubrobacteraceae bacterium]